MLDNSRDEPAGAGGTGALAQNILYFARALREAGLPVGPGAVLDALNAVEAAGIGDKADFRQTLHAVFVKKHEHTLLFDQAFAIYWKRKGLIEKLVAMMSPQARPDKPKKQKAEAGATRVADALFKAAQDEAKAAPSLDLDARLTMSAEEILRTKDFAQMSAAEIAAAKAQIARLAMPQERVRTRRFVADASGRTHRSAPLLPPLAQRRRRDRPDVSRARRASSRRSSRCATFPARWRNTRACSCISCTRSARRGG